MPMRPPTSFDPDTSAFEKQLMISAYIVRPTRPPTRIVPLTVPLSTPTLRIVPRSTKPNSPDGSLLTSTFKFDTA